MSLIVCGIVVFVVSIVYLLVAGIVLVKSLQKHISLYKRSTGMMSVGLAHSLHVRKYNF